MNNTEEFSFPEMKKAIARAGNLFYQYRACRRDASTIYDIENIRHGVVYARTPLEMNDPFDSMIGFSVEEIYEECIDIALNKVDATLDDELKLVIKNLLKYRLLGETLNFVDSLNKLKKYILTQSIIAHVPLVNFAPYIVRDVNKLYKKCPGEIKRYLTKEAFLIFALMIKDYKNDEIEESTIVETLKMEDVLKELEVVVTNSRDNIYLPFIKDFLSKLTVSCFSASGWDNHLMWSHYANCYSGICVEYDFEKMNEFIGFMYPVDYSDIRPTVSLKDMGLNKFEKDAEGNLITDEVNIKAIFSYLLKKNKCWSYEEEWRLVNVEGEPYTPLFINAPFVKSITIGLNLDDMCKQLLWDVCQERNIECYQLIINASDYTLSRELLTSESFIFDKEKEEQYINLIAEHTVILSEKMKTNTQSLIKAIEDGNFEATSMINVLTYMLDFLSDAYFMKISFNRFCKNTGATTDDVISNEQISTGVSQIIAMVSKTKIEIESIESSVLNLMLLKKITQKDMIDAKKLISGIKEMIKKHEEIKWFALEDKMEDI